MKSKKIFANILICKFCFVNFAFALTEFKLPSEVSKLNNLSQCEKGSNAPIKDFAKNLRDSAMIEWGYFLLAGLPLFAPKAKRIIYLFQNGAPSQLDLFDYKPKLNEMQGQELPESIRNGQRLTGMTSNQAKFPLAGSVFKFKQYGEHGAWISELLPYISNIADELCFIRTMHTEAINHDPALTFFQTGAQVGNRPSMGSWLSYGLGSENKNLPAFCVLLSKGKGNGQGVYSKLWTNGFLDSIHQGV